MNSCKLTIILPLPPKELSPNARPHFRAKAKATKQYRDEAHAHALVASFKLQSSETELYNTLPWRAATVQCRFYFAQNRRRDADNLLASMKSAFDGLRDSGVLVDDDRLTHMPVEWTKDKNDPRVELEIWETKAR